MYFWVFSSQIVLSDCEFHVKVLLCPLNLHLKPCARSKGDLKNKSKKLQIYLGFSLASLTDRWMLSWTSGSGMWCNAYITNNMACFVVQYTNSWSGRSWQQTEYFGWIFHQACNSFSCLCAVPDIILYNTKLMTSLNLHLDIASYIMTCFGGWWKLSFPSSVTRGQQI